MLNEEYKTFKMKNGYIACYMPQHNHCDKAGIVYEHVLIAEEMLGRALKSGEVVHHIDRNRENNKPENLMVFASSSAHALFHAGAEAIKMPDGSYTAKPKTKPVCKKCGAQISINKTGLCSACYQDEMKKKRIFSISKDELVELIQEKSAEEIGRQYGVSGKTVAKRLKEYGIKNDYAARMRGRTVRTTKNIFRKSKT